MFPRIQPGSFILAFKSPKWLVGGFFCPLSTRHIGKMYYLKHPQYGYIVKTLSEVKDASYYFRGESEQSISSEAIGALSNEHIIGRVIWVISAK